jgi:hypothetical protein
VGLAQILQPTSDRRVGHALEVEWWIERSQDISLEMAEGVDIFEWHGNDLEVCVHPGRQ